MTELWLCKKTTARYPFQRKEPGMEFHNIEELCYYLYENIDVVEDTFFDPPFFLWLREELMLPRLSEVLEQYRKQGKNGVYCGLFLLKEVGMYSDRELEKIEQLSSDLEHLSVFQQRKSYADRLLRRGRYMAGIRQYETLLHEKEASLQDEQWIGSIYHNLGTAYANLFLFAEAEECFKKAYARNQNPESLDAWKLSVQLQTPKDPVEGAPVVEDWNHFLHTRMEDYKRNVL